MIEEYIKNIKNLYRDKTTFLAILLFFIIGLQVSTIVFCVYAYSDISKKIDFRYFNTTRSLEYIHNVRIDTYDGSVKNYR